jgi:murein DD-endopeptidase MepM/ murein hydrolase activator NlpD
MAGEKLVQKALQAAMEARAAKHVADPAERAANLAKWQAGTPAQVAEPTWYHGTHREFDQFKPGQSDATFVTQDPSFANLFAMKKQPLTDFDPATKQWKALREGSDLQPNIMPVHVRAQNPFDYNNPAHIKALRKELEPDFVHDPELKRFVGQASMGDWGAIESSPIQSALKALGHDSFFVKEDGTRNLAVYDPNRQLKSATGNTGQFDPEIPRIDEHTGGEVEREHHAGGKRVVDKALEALRGNSRLTQIATTGPSYEKGLAHLAREGIEGPAIDYGAGRGHGLRSIGADTFEPYPQGWTPTYTDPQEIPDEMYRRLLNLNVLNVLDPAARDAAVENMGRIIQPGGGGIISTRGRDVMAAKGTAGPEPMSLIIGEGDNARYQKGFTPKELREYVGDTLGPRFDVDPSDVGAASVLFRRNREEGGPVYQSTGEKLVDDGKINWGDPNEARDFFRADAERMRQEKAEEDARLAAADAARRSTIEVRPLAAPGQPEDKDAASVIGVPEGATVYPVIGTFIGGSRSGYGAPRPTLSSYMRQHSGADWQAENGSPVYSPSAGTVVYTGKHSGYGNVIDVMNADGTVMRYAVHEGEVNVAPGQKVAPGQVLGTIGGGHLHHEIIKSGSEAAKAAAEGRFGYTARLPNSTEQTINPMEYYKLEPNTRVYGVRGLSKAPAYGHGGEVDQALNVVREHHADGEAVGDDAHARFRAGLNQLGRSEDVPPMDPAVMGENWANAVRRFRENPVREGEATVRPLELGARDVIGGAIAGDAPNTSYTTELRRRAADALIGSKGLPDSGTLGFGLADLPMVTGAPLQVADLAQSLKEGDYLGAGMNAALPAAFYARKPIADAGRRALSIAREYAPQIAGAGTAAAVMSPEQAEASKVKAVQDVIRAANYKPTSSLFFDYSRLHEIPKVTQSDLFRYDPARGVPARVTDVAANPDVRNKMLDVITSGKEMGGANWYNADPLRDLFINELGKDTGASAFRKYMDLVAATSPRSDVGTNARNASYYYGRLMRGEGAPEVGERNPQPYGHMAQRLHQMNVQRVANEGWDPLKNPKPASFVENLVGNQEPVTVDTHAFRLPAILAQDPRYLETAYEASKGSPKINVQKLVESGEMPMEQALKTAAYWEAQPKKNEYAAMEQYYKSLARELGMTPAQTQASAWVGGGKLTGLASDESKPFLGFLEDRVMNTATKLNMDPKDVMRAFIRGEQPLYNKGGTVEDHALNVIWKNGSK